MLVALRLALGWHFLYEGVWKIRHPDQFLAETEGVLSGARGPVAGLFYGMLPDIDGHQRLEANLPDVVGKDADIQLTQTCKLAMSWNVLRQQFVDFYRPMGGDDGTKLKQLHEQLTAEAKRVYDRHVQGLHEFVKEKGDEIKAHFESLKRYEEGLKSDPRAVFQKQRRWDEMQDLRKEAKGWIADLESRENALKGELLDLLRKERKSEVEAVLAATKEDAAKAEAKKAKAESKGPGPASVPAEPPAGAKKSAAAKPKTTAEEKPAAPPKVATPKKAKAKEAAKPKGTAKVKEADDPGSEEFAGAAKKTIEPSPQPSPEGRGESKVAPSPQPSPEGRGGPRQAADATAVVDFSPLAESHAVTASPFAASKNPLAWKRIEQLAFLLTWSLFGIGLCLMLGLLTRPAALAGAGFMLSVVLSQPSYPFVFPADPPQLGHALLVNKDFVEMIALLVIASTCLGRWTGLDFFIHNYLIKPFCGRCCHCGTSEGQEA